jgi:SAM-dependent methyltransferase
MVGGEVWSRRRTSFGAGATNYASGRPHYPRETVEWCVPPGARTALDLGAGTGVLTQGLLAIGLDVVSVEPLAEMRALIPAAAHAVDGSAEDIPAPDAGFDAVLVGQAWHWFDEDRALAETRRVLRPGGSLGLMWNLLDTDEKVTRTVADIIEAEERADMMLEDDTASPFDSTTRFGERFGPPERLVVSHSESYDVGRLLAYALSRSQAIILEPAERAALVDRLRAAMPASPFSLHMVCEAWRATAI